MKTLIIENQTCSEYLLNYTKSLGLEYDIVNPSKDKHSTITLSLSKYKYIVIEPNVYNPVLINRIAHDIISANKNPNWWGEDKELHILDSLDRFNYNLRYTGLDSLSSVAGILYCLPIFIIEKFEKIEITDKKLFEITKKYFETDSNIRVNRSALFENVDRYDTNNKLIGVVLKLEERVLELEQKINKK